MADRNIHSLRLSIIFVTAVFLSFLSPLYLPASEPVSEPVEVKEIRQLSSKGYTRVVIELSTPVEFSSKRISNPDRLYFDLKNSRISKEINTTLPVGDGILKTVRAGQFSKDTVRVVLQPAGDKRF